MINESIECTPTVISLSLSLSLSHTHTHTHARTCTHMHAHALLMVMIECVEGGVYSFGSSRLYGFGFTIIYLCNLIFTNLVDLCSFWGTTLSHRL